jgi:hypothetical protein
MAKQSPAKKDYLRIISFYIKTFSQKNLLIFGSFLGIFVPLARLIQQKGFMKGMISLIKPRLFSFFTLLFPDFYILQPAGGTAF